VVLNPVRAGLVQRVNQWPWSSYKATAGLKKGPAFLSTEWVLSQFGRRRAMAQRAYRDFVREGRDVPSPMDSIGGGILLGSEEFVARCRELYMGDKALEEVPRTQRYAGRPSLESLFVDVDADDRPGRNRRIAQAYLEHGYTMKAIGACCEAFAKWPPFRAVGEEFCWVSRRYGL